MEQFRQIGEALGSMKALMVFKDNIQINKRQCLLLIDIFSSAYDTISDEMRQNLRFEEKQTKWRVLEAPLRELHRTFKEAEHYIRLSLENKDWWAKAITLYQNSDCVQFYIHNLFCCLPVAVEAIEIASEMSGSESDMARMHKMKHLLASKYHKEWRNRDLFEWRFGRQYLVSHELCDRLEGVWKEDRWVLLNKIQERSMSNSPRKPKKIEQRITDLLCVNLGGMEPLNGRLLPSSILVGSKDYQVKQRLGYSSQYKEILWLGENFVLRHFFGKVDVLDQEITFLLSLSHPHILHFLCGFTDDERKECFLVMELMSKDLCSYMNEICGPKRRVPFSLPVAVDLMLQIARGMEYLHSNKIYHGELNPSNILVKARGVSADGYLHAKISGFGLSSAANSFPRPSPNQNGASSSGCTNGTNPFIWFAPEVLAEQEVLGTSNVHSRHTEKSDVYSFAMVCFELLTGKVPFEDGHLQGDKMSRNIRAGERPLFPSHSPRYITNLTKKCWHTDPNQRPSFSSICRILRYVKRFLVMNPDHSQPEPPMPLVDYCDIEARLIKEFPHWGSLGGLSPVSEIPFQMFAYRIEEKEKLCISPSSDSGSNGSSACLEENLNSMEECIPPPTDKKFLASQLDATNKKISELKMHADVKSNRQQPGTPKGRSVIRPPQMKSGQRSMRMNSESQLMNMKLKARRRTSGHASDSEIP